MSVSEYDEQTFYEEEENEEDDKAGFDTIDYMAQLQAGLQMYEIIPEAILSMPSELMRVVFPSKAVVLIGNILKPEEVVECPLVCWPAEHNVFYTLCMINLDCPTSGDTGLSEWLHWLVINIPGPDLDMNQADLIAQYVGVAPPFQGGAHRYVLLAFKQPQRLSLNEEQRKPFFRADNLRTKFSVRTFMKELRLCEKAAACNFFLSQWTEFVPRFYLNLETFYPSAETLALRCKNNTL